MAGPRVWYMMGVKGKLSRKAYQGFQKVCRLAYRAGEDVFVTSIAEGLHGMASLHYAGMTTDESDAWDMRPLRLLSFETIKAELGSDFDVVREADHWHIEYDPKRQ